MNEEQTEEHRNLSRAGLVFALFFVIMVGLVGFVVIGLWPSRALIWSGARLASSISIPLADLTRLFVSACCITSAIPSMFSIICRVLALQYCTCPVKRWLATSLSCAIGRRTAGLCFSARARFVVMSPPTGCCA